MTTDELIIYILKNELDTIINDLEKRNYEQSIRALILPENDLENKNWNTELTNNILYCYLIK